MAKSAEATASSIADLESEIDTVQREIDRREEELADTQTVLTLLRKDYVTEMTHVEELIVENARTQEELDIKEQMRDSIAQELQGLEDDVAKYELEIEALTRTVTKTAAVQNALASKAEEVALLQVSAENAASTGTAILYGAEANPLKVAPARAKIVIACMLAALVLCGFFVCWAKIVSAEEGEADQRPPAKSAT